jgi:hypothetical protein
MSPKTKDKAKSGSGWHAEYATGVNGTTFRYIVLDPTPRPRLVETTCVTRIVGRHAPIEGHGLCCSNIFVTETSVYVEHTTWGELWTTSICNTCAEKAERFLQAQELARKEVTDELANP